MKNMASGTAEGIAYMRYFESARPIEQRICNDYMAYRLMAWWVRAAVWLTKPFPLRFMDWAFEKKGRGMSGYIAMRARLFDDYVLDRIAAGVRQYVILGAGLDSRPYRFHDRLQGIPVFEVDHPLSQQVKKERVARYFGRLPDYVRYVPVDFTRESLFDCLTRAGYAADLPTVFTMEGVTMYLPEAAVRETLSLISGNSGPGSSLMMDYVYQAALDGRIKNRVIRHMNTLKFIFNEPILFGIDFGQAEQFLLSLGYDRAQDYPPQRLHDLYLRPITPQRPISDAYAIVAAYKD